MNSAAGHTADPGSARANLAGDARWLAVLASLTVVEFIWWALCWRAGIAPAPRFATYLALAVVGLSAAFLPRRAFRKPSGSSWQAILLGTLLIAIAASLFLPLKYAIPGQIPFWLDRPLALIERGLFGTDPWRIADRLFGWALVPIDLLYALWLPVQSLALFSLVLLPPSPAKSRALIAYSLAWFLLGVVLAVLCASAGPIFYDRLLGGNDFATLTNRLTSRAPMAKGEADAMWASFASARPGLVAGMSAMPSLHVAISFWMWLTARSLAPRLAPLALAYAIFMWVASVQLGWHYVSDGLVGAVLMIAIWSLAQKVDASLSASSPYLLVHAPSEQR